MGAGPFAQPRKKEPEKRTREDKIVHVASFRDPVREIDKLTEWVNSAIMLAAALGWLSPGASAMLHNGTTLGVLLRSLAAKKGREG